MTQLNDENQLNYPRILKFYQPVSQMTAMLVDDVLEELRECKISELASRAIDKVLALVFMVILVV